VVARWNGQRRQSAHRQPLAAAPIGTKSSGQVIVVWKDVRTSRILYSIGTAGRGDRLAWKGILAIPGAATSDGPAVYRPQHSNVIIVTWKAARGSAIDFVVGLHTASGRVKWGKVGVIKGAATSTTPAIAEASTGGKSGKVYVLWKAPGAAGPIDFATTADPVHGSPTWSAPRALPHTVRTGAAPSAQALGKDKSYPLLVVFRALKGSALLYVTLAKDGKTTSPLAVPHIRSLNGTTISPGVLAAEAPDPLNVFYEPFVRPCAGC